MTIWQIEKVLKVVVWYLVKIHNHRLHYLVPLQLQRSLQFLGKINHSLEAVRSFIFIDVYIRI